MRKVILSSLVVASVALGFEEFDSAVKDINSTMANMQRLLERYGWCIFLCVRCSYYGESR